MSEMQTALEEYLAMRRSLGFALERAGKLLPDFVSYLQEAGTTTITTAAALDWACQTAAATPAWQAQRLAMVRGFARYLHALDASHQVPPTGLLPARRRRTTPHLYSEEQIAALMTRAMQLVPPWRATLYPTLIGLLATTGLRLGEALGLDCDDVDLDDGWLLVRHAKGGRSRQVALHESTVRALTRYARDRHRCWPEPGSTAFFLSVHGARLGAATVHDNFRALVQAAGLAPAEGRWPRPHDLRHAFAVRTVLGWYRQGEDVQARLPILSTWLGHVSPSDTYWYLQASPELLSVAAERLNDTPGTPS